MSLDNPNMRGGEVMNRSQHQQMRDAINDVELALNGLEIDSVVHLFETADDSVMVKLPLGALRQLARCYPTLNYIINDPDFNVPPDDGTKRPVVGVSGAESTAESAFAQGGDREDAPPAIQRGIIYLTPHEPSHSSAAESGDLPDSGAPIGTGWLEIIPDTEPLFLGVTGLNPEVRVTLQGRDYSGVRATIIPIQRDVEWLAGNKRIGDRETPDHYVKVMHTGNR